MENKSKEFNLLDEKWILVMKAGGSIEEVSLPDALLHAQEYTDLAGETETQDIAMLRLLLAVMHAVFGRVDAEGHLSPLTGPKDALTRWKMLWDRGQLPEKPIRDYLEKYRERFWLFHPDRPFYQSNSASIGTEYTPAKLNGILSESSNKIRLFPMIGRENKARLDYAAAARWLLFVNGYDDTSSKPKGKNLPSVGTGWLGKLGIITAQGSNLFETLMLNFVLLDENNCPWSSNVPVWEQEPLREGERTQVPLPNDQAELLTLQSRRLLLKREDGFVIGYTLLGGDFFEKDNAFSEQMTVWRTQKGKKGEIAGYTPVRHDQAKKMWQNFGTIVVPQEGIRQPGVIRWNLLLKKQKCIEKSRYLCCREAAVLYGKKDFFIASTFSDSMIMHSSLMDEVGTVCQRRIQDEIGHCEEAANKVGYLAYEIELAEGGIDKHENIMVHAEEQRAKAKEQFYYRIDLPFREWLRSLDPSDSDFDIDAVCDSWDDRITAIAEALGKEIVDSASASACSGRKIEDRFYCVPLSYNRFKASIKKFKSDKEE